MKTEGNLTGCTESGGKSPKPIQTPQQLSAAVVGPMCSGNGRVFFPVGKETSVSGRLGVTEKLTAASCVSELASPGRWLTGASANHGTASALPRPPARTKFTLSGAQTKLVQSEQLACDGLG